MKASKSNGKFTKNIYLYNRSLMAKNMKQNGSK